jgi:hypothetical protein
MKPLTQKQIKTVWIVAAVLVIIHFTPRFIQTVRQQFSHAPVPARPAMAIPPPRPVPVPVNAQGLSPEVQTHFLGAWEGSQYTANNDQCKVHLELRPSPDQPGSISGYETRSCFNIPQFMSGKAPQGGLAAAMKEYSPVATVLTGKFADGEITFNVEKTIGSSPFCLPDGELHRIFLRPKVNRRPVAGGGLSRWADGAHAGSRITRRTAIRKR